MAKSIKSNPKSKQNGKELLQYYRDMMMVRRFEEKAGQLYGMGLIGGFCHPILGNLIARHVI